MDGFYTVNEVCRLLHVARETLRRWERDALVVFRPNPVGDSQRERASRPLAAAAGGLSGFCVDQPGIAGCRRNSSGPH